MTEMRTAKGPGQALTRLNRESGVLSSADDARGTRLPHGRVEP